MSGEALVTHSLLTPKQTAQITEAVTERWEDYLRPGERFEVRAERTDADVSVSIVLHSPKPASVYTVETGLAVPSSDKAAVQEALRFLLDAADAVLGEYLEEDRGVVLSPEWSTVTSEGRELRARATLRKPELESKADQILARQRKS
jgi:hypothetical protein